MRPLIIPENVAFNTPRGYRISKENAEPLGILFGRIFFGIVVNSTDYVEDGSSTLLLRHVTILCDRVDLFL